MKSWPIAKTGKTIPSLANIPDFEVPARVSDIAWSVDEGRGYRYYTARIGPLSLFVEDHEVHGITWRVGNAASLTDANRIEFAEAETDVERAKKKCFTIVNFIRIIKDDFAQLEA